MTTLSASSPSPSSVGLPGPVLTAGYEELRRQATERLRGGPVPRGLILLMRQGITAWMSTWNGDVAAADEAVPMNTPIARQASIPGPCYEEMVKVLAGIVLGAVPGGER